MWEIILGQEKWKKDIFAAENVSITDKIVYLESIELFWDFIQTFLDFMNSQGLGCGICLRYFVYMVQTGKIGFHKS